MHEPTHAKFPLGDAEMVVTLLVLGAVPKVTVHPNASFGGAIWSSHETNWYIKYLAVTSFEACLEACRAWDAQPGAKCKAAQWYYPNSTEPRSQGCYARIDGLNQTTPQQDVISAQLAWPCVTDEDCNLNGVCGANGTCACDPQWDGADCGALRLLPAPKDGGTATWFATRNGSSQWGGNPFRSFDGRYHVFVVEMTKSCAIVDYTTNSRIVQASSASPLGPYEFDTVWRAPFAHTPRAWPGPNGSLLVAYVGRQAVPDAAQRDCRGEGGARAEARGGAVADVEEKAGTGQDFSYRNPECVGIMVAQSASGNLSGPWTHNFVYDPSIDEWYGAPGLTGQQGGAPGGINNPSLLVLPNGTALLAGRTCTWPEHVIVAKAPSWQGPYRSVTPGRLFAPSPWDPSDEDPFLWQDKRGNFHMLLHHQDNQANQLYLGAHAYSRDGITWTWSPTIAYTKLVEWDDGTSLLMCRRERPALLLDPTWRVPLALFSAVSDCKRDYMHAQPINQD